MSLPVWTTTVTVLRPDETGTQDPWVASTINTLVTIATGVHAVLSRPEGSEKDDGMAGREQLHWKFAIDPTDLNHDDWLKDESTGLLYQVEWVRLRQMPQGGLGGVGGGVDISHLEGKCVAISGEAS